MMNYAILRENCAAWQQYVKHDFVEQLAAGTLPQAAFQYYLQQDYLFLQQFVRAWGLAVYKSRSPEEMRTAQASINALLDYELGLHVQYCAEHGVSEEQLLNIAEDPANIAYTRYVLDCGNSGTLIDLYAALLPCICGYAEIGERLSRQTLVENNPYQKWIDTYADREFQAFAAGMIEKFNHLLADTSPAQQQSIQKIFDTATHMEVNFWQMGLDHQ